MNTKEYPFKIMKEAYVIAQNKCGLKVGDRVKIARKAKDKESGWSNTWTNTMNECIGKIGEIVELHKNGISILFKDNKSSSYYHFPFFVLEKVEEEATSEPKLIENSLLDSYNLIVNYKATIDSESLKQVCNNLMGVIKLTINEVRKYKVKNG